MWDQRKMLPSLRASMDEGVQHPMMARVWLCIEKKNGYENRYEKKGWKRKRDR